MEVNIDLMNIYNNFKQNNSKICENSFILILLNNSYYIFDDELLFDKINKNNIIIDNNKYYIINENDLNNFIDTYKNKDIIIINSNGKLKYLYYKITNSTLYKKNIDSTYYNIPSYEDISLNQLRTTESSYSDIDNLNEFVIL